MLQHGGCGLWEGGNGDALVEVGLELLIARCRFLNRKAAHMKVLEERNIKTNL
jgi:hypothetical protein